VTDDGGKVSDVEGHLVSITIFFCFVISNEDAKKLVFGVIRIDQWSMDQTHLDQILFYHNHENIIEQMPLEKYYEIKCI